MSFERWYLPCVRLLSVLAVIMVVTVSAQADDTWHNVYHSLKRFFTGKPSATPVVHHRVRRSEDRERANPSPASTPATAENAPTPALPPLHASSFYRRLHPLRRPRQQLKTQFERLKRLSHRSPHHKLGPSCVRCPDQHPLSSHPQPPPPETPPRTKVRNASRFALWETKVNQDSLYLFSTIPILMSRRDDPIVAWHEVPGTAPPQKKPSRRVRCDSFSWRTASMIGVRKFRMRYSLSRDDP